MTPLSAAAPIALTGATGFLGRALCSQLLQRGDHVRALARMVSALPAHERLTPIAGDLRDPAALAALCAGAGGVIHCAGLVKARSREEFFAVNAEATAALAQQAAQQGLRRFVLISSLAAREPSLSAYCASKAAGEARLRAHAALDWTIVRPPAIYGPGDRELAKLLALARFGFAPALGPPSARISMIHVRDAASAIAAAYDCPATYRQTYEIDDGASGHSWGEMAAALSLAQKRRVRSVPIPLALAGIAAGVSAVAARLSGQATIFTPGKLREMRHSDWVSRAGNLTADAGWRPTTGLAEGFAQLAAKAQPLGKTQARPLPAPPGTSRSEPDLTESSQIG
jgi:2-alkyl-3-oxoalkanoate reductase